MLGFFFFRLICAFSCFADSGLIEFAKIVVVVNKCHELSSIVPGEEASLGIRYHIVFVIFSNWPLLELSWMFNSFSIFLSYID